MSESLQARHGAVAEPLLRHEGGAEPAPRGDAAPAATGAVDADRIGVARRSALAGQRVEQLVLAVAGDAGDADDLAAAHVER